MKPSKILKLFKKGGKAAAKKGAKGAPEIAWPAGTRIGVYGHSNSGKTVYFTVLNEDCKVARNMQISVTDSPTAGEFLMNYRGLWGVGATSDVGTVVDLKGEKKFPPPTASDKVLQFTAIVDRSLRLPIVTYDYNGRAISISESHDLKDKVMNFMVGADGIIFFFDPKALIAELQCQAHVASFVNLLENIAPGGGRLPIPIALVISKADILNGFTGKDQSVLINPEDEAILAEDYELFLERVLSSNRIASNSQWAGTVRDVLVKLKDFLKEAIGRTLDFQIFFVSCTGEEPEKIGSDVGRSIYMPPKKLQPAGVREPFYWILKAVARSRRLDLMRSISKWVAMISIVFAVLWSLPFAFHFWYLLPDATRTEDKVLAQYTSTGSAPTYLSKEEIRQILPGYNRYSNSWTTKNFFKEYQVVAKAIIAKYAAMQNVNVDKAMDNIVSRFAAIVADSANWPSKKVGDTTLVDNDQRTAFDNIQAELSGLNILDQTSHLNQRRDRVLWLWENFRSAILNPQSDTTSWRVLKDKVSEFEKQPGVQLSAAETQLYNAFKGRQVKTEQKVIAQQTGSDIKQFIATINNNPSPSFRIDDVPNRLQKSLPDLQADPANKDLIAKINQYLDEARRFKTEHKYVFWLAECPANHHVHITVDHGSHKGIWRAGKQLYPVVIKDTLSWKEGDDIEIALDKDPHNPTTNPETWGAKSALKQVLNDRLCLFDMTQPIIFGDKTISFQFEQDLTQLLPKFPE